MQNTFPRGGSAGSDSGFPKVERQRLHDLVVGHLQGLSIEAALESGATLNVAERISPAEIAEIKALHDDMLACRAERDLPGYYSLSQAIHNKISEAARNFVMREVYLSVNRCLLALRFKSNFRRQMGSRSCRTWRDDPGAGKT